MTTLPATARTVRRAVLATAVSAGVIGAGLAHGEAGPVVSAHLVEIRHLRFEPGELAVSTGDTVVWVNRDLVPHTVAADDGSWSSGPLARGESWRTVVHTEDDVRYLCEYHPTMRGILRGRGPSGVAAPLPRHPRP